MLKNVSRVFNFSQHFPPVHLERPSWEEAGLMAWPWHWGFLRAWVTVPFCCLNSMPREHCIPNVPGDHKHPKLYVPPAWAGRSSRGWGFILLRSGPPLLSPKGLCGAREPQNSCKIMSMPRWQGTLSLGSYSVLLGMWSRNTWDTSLLLYTPGSWQMGRHSRYWINTNWVNEQAVFDC